MLACLPWLPACSVDEYFHVPHFEKMCYDNPQIALTYLAAFQITKANGLAFVVRGVLDYLRRDMTSKEGGLFSAEVRRGNLDHLPLPRVGLVCTSCMHLCTRLVRTCQPSTAFTGAATLLPGPSCEMWVWAWVWVWT